MGPNNKIHGARCKTIDFDEMRSMTEVRQVTDELAGRSFGISDFSTYG